MLQLRPATRFSDTLEDAPHWRSDVPGFSVVIHSDPEILGGTPVFVGTRLPFQALIDYLEGGHPPTEFLDDFPSVTHAQAVAALELARDAVLERLSAA